LDLESEHQIPSIASFQDSAAISIVVHAGVSDIFVTTIQSTGVFDRDKSSPATIDAGYSGMAACTKRSAQLAMPTS
jgi:hypothetical protein